MAKSTAYAEIDNKFAYTKGWESTAKTPTTSANIIGQKYGPKAQDLWLAGFADNAAGSKKWETFLETAAEETPASDFMDKVNGLAAEATEAVEQAETLANNVIAVSQHVELDDTPISSPVLTIVGDGDEFAPIASQRNWINPKTQTKEDVAGARAEIVKRKGNHRAGFNAAKRGEKPLEEIVAKYTERHGQQAGWDFANGYAEFNRGETCGTAWAKK